MHGIIFYGIIPWAHESQLQQSLDSGHTQADMIESAIICWEASWTSRRVWASQIFHSKCCGAHIIYCDEYIRACHGLPRWHMSLRYHVLRLTTRTQYHYIISIYFYEGRWIRDGRTGPSKAPVAVMFSSRGWSMGKRQWCCTEKSLGCGKT